MINLVIMSKEEYEERFNCSLEQPPVKYIICHPENWDNIVVYEDGTIMVFNENGEGREIDNVSDLIECML